jgi:serine-type D-Ala-D-Ala carboxypeptidase (penicillin-binding protein 5/6)
MKNTRFMNATGLPDAQHYSTAQDLYTLSAALIGDFPTEYAQYYSQKEYRYNNIAQPNGNRLLWIDPSVDGVKTGHTEAAGYCLVASSRRGGRRLLWCCSARPRRRRARRNRSSCSTGATSSSTA